MRTPIEHVGDDGTRAWRVRLRKFSPKKRRMVNGSETFYTKAEADRFCKLMAAMGADAALAYLDTERAEQMADAHGTDTFDAWFDRYLSTLTGIEDETLAGYRSMNRLYLAPDLGDLPVSAIDRTVVAKLVNGLARRPHHQDADRTLSAKTIANAHGLLSSVLSYALAEGVIDTNPAQRTRLPRQNEHETEDIRFLTRDEFDRLLEHVPDPWLPLVVFLAGTGCRWSEATALQVRDLTTFAAGNAEVPAVRIVRAWKRKRGEGFILGPPKSRKSRRTVTLPSEALDLLRPLVTDQPRGAFVFRTPAGNPVHRGNFYNRVWRPACLAAGLVDPRPKTHDLRHSHASWLIAEGVQLEVIQDRLGHESILTTRRIYGHLQPDMQIQAAYAAQVIFARRLSAPAAAGAAPSTPALVAPAQTG